MPAGGVGVGDAVGDVEPAEVVVEVELAGRVVAQHPLGHRVDHDVEHPVDAGAVAQRVDRGDAAARPDRTRSAAVDRVVQAAVVAPRRVGVDGGERVEVDAGERLGERAHVRQRVLARAVDDRRHEVRQHRVGPLPAQPVEQLERLLGVDRAVAVAKQVIADDGGEPRPQLVGGPAGVDGAAEQRLRRLELLGLDEAAELARRIGAERRSAGSGSGLTGRSRSVSAIPAMPCTIGRARWSPS